MSKPHAHVIPNTDTRTAIDPSKWFRVAYFDGRGQWTCVFGPMSEAEAKRDARRFNRRAAYRPSAKGTK